MTLKIYFWKGRCILSESNAQMWKMKKIRDSKGRKQCNMIGNEKKNLQKFVLFKHESYNDM